MSEQHQSERRSIQGIDLLEEEEITLTLDGQEGLEREPSPHGDILFLTNRRIMRLAKESTRERFSIAYLEDIDSVEITTPSRNSGSLVTGGLLVLAGILAGIMLAGLLNLPLLISLATAGALGGLGILSSSKYFFPDETATLLFRIGASEMALPLRSRRALHDAYFLVNHLFMLRAGQHPHTPAEKAAVTGIEEQPSLTLEIEQEAAPTMQASPSPDGAYGNPVEADVGEMKESAGGEQNPYAGHEEADHTSHKRPEEASP